MRGHDFIISEWAYEKPPIIHDPFVLRQDLILENIVAEQQRIRELAEEINIEFEKEPME